MHFFCIVHRSAEEVRTRAYSSPHPEPCLLVAREPSSHLKGAATRHTERRASGSGGIYTWLKRLKRRHTSSLRWRWRETEHKVKDALSGKQGLFEQSVTVCNCEPVGQLHSECEFC